MKLSFDIASFFRADAQADRVVPPTGITAQLTILTAASMAFLAVFALALTLASDRLADRWAQELAQTSTVRIVAPPALRAAQTQTVLQILDTTAGVASARLLDDAEQQALLAPWFGPDLDLSALPVPSLIEVVQDSDGVDATGLRLRLEAEVPTAVFDDHEAWRAPLVNAAHRLRLLGWLCAALITLSVGAMVTLAAHASLAANAQVIQVLRLVGATDDYIAQAFIRRFSLRALIGAAIGTALAMIAVFALPAASDQAGLLTGLGFQRAQWLLPCIIPFVAAGVAFGATRLAAQRTLKELS